MKYTEFKKFLFALQTVIVVLLTGFALPCIAEKEAAIFSGGVVDTDGNPVAGLPVFIAPAEIEAEWIDTLFFLMSTPRCVGQIQMPMDSFP